MVDQHADISKEAAKDHQLEVEAVFDNEDASRRRVIEQLKKDMLVCGRW